MNIFTGHVLGITESSADGKRTVHYDDHAFLYAQAAPLAAAICTYVERSFYQTFIHYSITYKWDFCNKTLRSTNVFDEAIDGTGGSGLSTRSMWSSYYQQRERRP